MQVHLINQLFVLATRLLCTFNDARRLDLLGRCKKRDSRSTFRCVRPNIKIIKGSWELPPKICQPRDVIAQTWYSWDVWDEEFLIGKFLTRVFFTVRKSKSLKIECIGALSEVPQKICTTLWRECDSEAKIVQNWLVGRPFEVKIRKICTTLWRESELEAKIVTTPGPRTAFWGSKCFSRGRRRISTQHPHKNA